MEGMMGVMKEKVSKGKVRVEMIRREVGIRGVELEGKVKEVRKERRGDFMGKMGVKEGGEVLWKKG